MARWKRTPPIAPAQTNAAPARTVRRLKGVKIEFDPLQRAPATGAIALATKAATEAQERREPM